ncbi:MAG: helical backbone metal receptor [Thermoplasmatota archaeon]
MRIVSLVPSLTETLYALGVGDSVVGVTHFCEHPKEAREKATRVGGTKNPKLDAIRDLAPDLVCVAVEENRKEDVDALQAAGIKIHVTDVRSVDDVGTMISELGQTVGAAPRRTEALLLSIDVARDAADAVAPEQPIPVFVPIWKDPWMTFNRSTYAHSILEAVGLDNRFAPFPERYPTIEVRDVAESGAKFALLPSEPYAFAERHRKEVAKAFGLDLEAVQPIDGQALTWWGARTPEGIRTLARVAIGLEAAS